MNIDTEVWKDIPGFEGYQISNFGRVRSCRLLGNKSTGCRLGPVWKNIKLASRGATKHPRPVVVIRKLGERKSYTFQIGRLMWELFKGPIPDGMVLDHIDGNPFNNDWSNLRITTQKNNVRNAAPKRSYRQFKGTMYNRRKWEAWITVDRKKIYLGTYAKEIEAAKAYNEAAIEYFGEYAKLNVIPSEVH